MAAETTTTLSAQVAISHQKRFLARAKHLLVHEDGAQKVKQSKNEGKVLRYHRYTPLSTATTPLTEGSNPSEVSLAATTVDATLAEYGNTVKVSRLLSLTSVDPRDEEKIDVVAQNMGETIDELARDAMYSGATAQLGNSKSAVSDIAVTDTFDYDEVKKAVRTLRANKAMTYGDGFFKGVVGPYTEYDLTASSAWLNVKQYQDSKDLYRGEIGNLYGVRFALTTNQKTESSTTTVYSNFIHGKHSFGTFDLSGDACELHIVPHTQIDSGNPTGRFSLISWAGAYDAQVLIADWIINVKSGATA